MGQEKYHLRILKELQENWVNIKFNIINFSGETMTDEEL